MMILPLLCALSLLLVNPAHGKSYRLKLGKMGHWQKIHFLGTCKKVCRFREFKATFKGDVDLFGKEGFPFLGGVSCNRDECFCAGSSSGKSKEKCVEQSKNYLDTFVITVGSYAASEGVEVILKGNINNLTRLSSDTKRAIEDSLNAIKNAEEMFLGDLEDGQKIHLYANCTGVCDIGIIIASFNGSGSILMHGNEASPYDDSESFCVGESVRRFNIGKCRMKSDIVTSSFYLTVKSVGEPKNVMIKIKGSNIEGFVKLTENTTTPMATK